MDVPSYIRSLKLMVLWRAITGCTLPLSPSPRPGPMLTSSWWDHLPLRFAGPSGAACVLVFLPQLSSSLPAYYEPQAVRVCVPDINVTLTLTSLLPLSSLSLSLLTFHPSIHPSLSLSFSSSSSFLSLSLSPSLPLLFSWPLPPSFALILSPLNSPLFLPPLV